MDSLIKSWNPGDKGRFFVKCITLEDGAGSGEPILWMSEHGANCLMNLSKYIIQFCPG